MKNVRNVLMLVLALMVFPSVASAAIVATGDVTPGELVAPGVTSPYDAGDMVNVLVGDTGTGTLDITSGSTVANHRGYVGNIAGSTGTVTVDGAGSKWTNRDYVWIGDTGTGTLNITDGGEVVCTKSTTGFYIGEDTGSTGLVEVDGTGSKLTTAAGLYVGRYGIGTLNITDGGKVVGNDSLHYIGISGTASSVVTVAGIGSSWMTKGTLHVNWAKTGTTTLTINDGGLVSAELLKINPNSKTGSHYINMTTGGMLALLGSATDLTGFLGLAEGSDDIRYWDGSAWDDITNATAGTNYTITAGAAGSDLDGYTILTVPEPATVGLLGIGGLLALVRKNRR